MRGLVANHSELSLREERVLRRLYHNHEDMADLVVLIVLGDMAILAVYFGLLVSVG